MITKAAYGYIGLLALSAVAFWPRYLSRPGREIDPYTHGHAIVALVWVFLLIAQPLLVRRSLRAHRLLGRFSYVVAPLFVAASLLLAHYRFRSMDEATFRVEAPTLFLPISAAVLFVLSYSLALVYRRSAPLHGRFMLATGLPMIDPVLGRVLFYHGPRFSEPLLYQAITFGVTDLVLLALLLLPDLPRESRRLFLIPAIAFPVAHLAWFTVIQGSGWVPIAAWFRALPLP